MSGFPFFGNDTYADGLHSAGHEGENQEGFPQHAGTDRLSAHMTLRRLLYRMERYDDMTTDKNTASTNATEGDTTTKEPKYDNNTQQQSWHSLLLRARMCQDLWQIVASENVDEGSDPHLRKEYLELSQRVDAACKRAHLLADQARERERASGKDKDLVGKLFFSQNSTQEKDQNGEGETIIEEDAGLETQGRIPVEDGYEDFESTDDDDSEAYEISTPTTRSHNANTKDNLQELQEAQREQIEEAIAMMARQMKESTKGIQNQLKQQNAKTLDELETVAEQNMEDVTKVAQNVKEHVVANQKSSWASWTAIILIVGVFVFTLLTIFTVPKHPDASISRILSSFQEDGPYARLVRKAMGGIRSVFGNDDEGVVSVATDETVVPDNEIEDYYDLTDDEEALREKEQLEKLVRDMRRGKKREQKEQDPHTSKETQPEIPQEESFPRHDDEENSDEQEQAEDHYDDDYNESEEDNYDTESDNYEGANEEEEEEEIQTDPSDLILDAASSGDYDALDNYLVDYPDLVNTQDDVGRTPLYLAVEGNHVELVELLLNTFIDENEFPDNNVDPFIGLFEDDSLPIDLALDVYGLNDPITELFFSTGWYERSEFENLEEEQDKTEEDNIEEDEEPDDETSDEQDGEDDSEQDDEQDDNSNDDIEDKSEMEDLVIESSFSEGDEQKSQTENAKDEISVDLKETINGISPQEILDAAASNNLKVLKRCLEFAPELINSQNERGWTPLHLAVDSKNLGAVRLLLDQYIDTDREDLLKRIINPDITSYDEEITAFELALEKYGDTNMITKVFFQKGWEDINDIVYYDEDGEEIEYKEKKKKPSLLSTVDKRAVNIGKTKNEPLKRRRTDGGIVQEEVSPKDIRAAAASNDFAELKRLLRLAPELINSQDEKGWTALHFAVDAEHSRIIEFLLNQDRQFQNEEMMQFNIDPYIKTYDDDVALDLLLDKENVGINNFLVKHFITTGWYDRSEIIDYIGEEEKKPRPRLQLSDQQKENMIQKAFDAVVEKELSRNTGSQEVETKEESKKKFDNPWGIAPEEEETLPGDSEDTRGRNDQESETKEAKKKNFDNPWGIEPEENIDRPSRPPSRLEQRQKRRGKDDIKEEPKLPKDVNVDDIFASLQQQQQVLDEDDAVEEDTADPTDAPFDDGDSEQFDPTSAFQREGMAAKFISPKDFRVAAASGDYEKMLEYLEIAPEHINRQDKFGWTALHLAVNANQDQIVKLLLEQYDEEDKESEFNIDHTIASYEEKTTAMNLAVSLFGIDHPVTDSFFDTGWYDRSEYEGYETHEELTTRRQVAAKKEEEARLREEKLREHASRIAKEREAIQAKEARIAAAAEEERRVKKEKLDRLFGTPLEEDNDDYDDEEAIMERRKRLDAILEEL